MEDTLLEKRFSLTKSIPIEDVENTLLAIQKEKNILLPVHKESLLDGVYVREVTMPKDSLFLGHKHKTKHLNIISKGSCLLIDTLNNTRQLIEAPYIFESLPGTRKLVYIIEECTWTNVHLTDKKTIEEVEEEIIEKSSIWYKYNSNKEIT